MIPTYIYTLSSNSVTNSTDTFYGILCSGLTEKTKLTFVSSNSSFSECVRSRFSFLSLTPTSYFPNVNCYSSPYSECQFDPSNPLVPPSSSSASFISCTFNTLSSLTNGGAICFTSSHTLSVLNCSFALCSSLIIYDHTNGGGAIFSNAASLLSVTTSTFTHCTASQSCGGGILAAGAAHSASVSFCVFIHCDANFGGGMSTHVGPASSISSCCYICCKASSCGGGLFHNSNKVSSCLLLSNSLFADNNASYSGQRGGGAFEDYGDSSYQSTYSFSFFAKNTAQNGIGNDIAIIRKILPLSNITHCFTTESTDSFYNAGSYQNDWLTLILITLIFSPYSIRNFAAFTHKHTQ